MEEMKKYLKPFLISLAFVIVSQFVFLLLGGTWSVIPFAIGWGGGSIFEILIYNKS
jgi:hypothetical protein